MKTLIFVCIFLIHILAQAEVQNISAKNENLSIQAEVFYPSQNPVGVVILTPTISGVSLIEKNLAKYFKKNGFIVIMPLPYLSEVDQANPRIENLDREFLTPAKNAKIFLNQLSDKIKGLPIYALGASQGGFRTLIITAEIPEINAAWIVTAGADFASIYANSKVEKIEIFKNKLKTEYQVETDSELESLLRAELKNDPINLCRNIDRPFVQVIALKDNKVPTYNQIKLKEACPDHKIIYYNTGHVSASLSMLKDKKKILNFFLENKQTRSH